MRLDNLNTASCLSISAPALAPFHGGRLHLSYQQYIQLSDVLLKALTQTLNLTLDFSYQFASQGGPVEDHRTAPMSFKPGCPE